MVQMEQTTKLDVDFKPSKKMKKRRELDALVSGKQTRRKSSSSHELLRSVDSESSDAEDFHVSSRKVRGQCNLCSSCTSLFGLFILTACLLVCAGLTWMHIEMKKDIESLRRGLEAVESRSQSSVQDLNSFMVKLSDVNKTIHSVQNGKNSLNEVIKNISYINNEISELSSKVNKLSEGLKAAPEIRNIPDKLLTVSKTVADLGSEVTVMKGQFDSFSQFVKTAETKLEELSNQVTNGTGMSPRPTDRADLTPDLAHLIQNIPGQLHSLNISLMTQMSLLQSELTEHEQRFGILKNKTATLSKSLSTVSHPTMPAMPGSSDIQSNPVDLKTQVDAILQEMMRNSSSSLGIVSLDKTTMLELLANMDNLTVTVKQLKDDYAKLLEAKPSPGSIDTNNNNNNGNLEQLLRSYDQSFNLRITTMNTSLTNLQHDFAHYVTIIGQHSNQLVDITNQINQIGRFLRGSVGNTTPPPQRAKPTPDKAETPDIFKPPATTGSKTSPKQTTKQPAATTQAPPRTTRGTEASETEAKVTKTPTGTTSAPHETILGPGVGAQSTLVPMKKQGGTTKGPSGEEGQEGETKTTGQADSGAKTEGPKATTKPPAIVSPVIKNMADLELNFRRWDIMGNRKVLYGILPGYLGESNMPSEEVLEEYDTNGDGLYSLRELANAFGFNFEDLPADNPFRVHDGEDNER